jgi:Kelch motif
VVEAQGGFIGTDLFLFTGFNGSASTATDKAVYFDTVSEVWTEVDPIPNPMGLSHMGGVVVGNKVYACGGFLGGLGSNYMATSECYVYTHGNASGTQWSAIPNLPLNRTGGALFHSTLRNSLFFATGAEAYQIGSKRYLDDFHDVWELALDDIPAGWVSRANLPYKANHVGWTTVLYEDDERHYVLGGQDGGREGIGNYNLLYEYNAVTNTWIQRANLTVGTGHISSSTVRYKNCGFFIVGGANNCQCKVSAIYYYDIGSNSWTFIGDLPDIVTTQVCDILEDWLYCIQRKTLFRRKIE